MSEEKLNYLKMHSLTCNRITEICINIIALFNSTVKEYKANIIIPEINLLTEDLYELENYNSNMVTIKFVQNNIAKKKVLYKFPFSYLDDDLWCEKEKEKITLKLVNKIEEKTGKTHDNIKTTKIETSVGNKKINHIQTKNDDEVIEDGFYTTF